jgi:ring-1,2-phenylacetyl-CoA epoxidase subunit PaaE
MANFHPLRIAAVTSEAEESVGVVFEPADSILQAFRHAPGQHIALRARLNGEEIRRTYSLQSAPGELPLRIAVRVQGRLSQHLASAGPGSIIEAAAPAGSFTCTHGQRRSIVVAFAAGSGITPVLPVIRYILETEGLDRRVMVFYGNRTVARTMLLENLLGLKNRHPERLAVHFIMSREPQEMDLYNGRIDGARVCEVAGRLFDPLCVSDYLVCGPGTMIRDVAAALQQLGVDPRRIHTEHFSAGRENALDERSGSLGTATVVGLSAPSASAPADALTKVRVTIDGRQRTFTMRTGIDNILDAASDAGIDLPYSCRAGVCSTCRTRLKSGDVQMDDNYALEDWELEQGFILACQAYATTAVLELDYDEK